MATVYWRGKSAYLNWHDEHGQHRISLGRVTPSEAESARVEKEYELATGRRVTPQAAVFPLFKDFAADYLAWFESEYPTSYYRVQKIVELIFVPEFGMTPMDQFNARMANAWKQKRSQEYSRRGKNPTRIRSESVNKELRQLRAMLNKAVEWGVIPAFPWPKKAVPQLKNLESKPPPFYEKAALKKLYLASGERRWWWQLYVNTGMRKAEGIHLRREHIRKGHLHILSSEDERTKSAKWRLVPINQAAKEALDRLPKDGYLLPRVHPNSIGRAFARDARRAGIGGSLHWLRHTFCTHLAMAGTPPPTIKELAGHASLATTERYMWASKNSKREAVKSIDL